MILTLQRPMSCRGFLAEFRLSDLFVFNPTTSLCDSVPAVKSLDISNKLER